jgi:hypothetical protein
MRAFYYGRRARVFQLRRARRIEVGGVGHTATIGTPCGSRAGSLGRPVENDNAAMDAETKRNCRWYQFSLRRIAPIRTTA